MIAPITFDADDEAISIITFMVNHDETCLSFNSTDADFNGVPDSVKLLVPSSFNSQVQVVGGAIQFVFFGLGVAMPDGSIVEITYTVSNAPDCSGATADVGFSSIGLTFRDSLGRLVTGWSQDGSVKIDDG